MRISRQTHRVLQIFLDAPNTWRYGYDVSQETGLKSGTLYPILMRLADRKLLEATWESSIPGTPPRHLYRLTPAGLSFAREHVLASPTGSSRPALSGAKS